MHQLPGAESFFAGGAPDVNAVGLQDQQPGMAAGQGLAHEVIGHFIVGGDDNGGLGSRGPYGVETRWDDVAHAADAPTDFAGAPPVCPGQSACYAGYLTTRRLKPVDKTRYFFRNNPTHGGIAWTSAGRFVGVVASCSFTVGSWRSHFQAGGILLLHGFFMGFRHAHVLERFMACSGLENA